MSSSITRTLKCDFCKMNFEAEIHESVNVTIDPELKPLVKSGEIFYVTCPHCGKRQVCIRPFIYHDMKNKFMVLYNDLPSVMAERESYLNPKDPIMANTLKDYTIVGVNLHKEMLTKIAVLEHGLDHRICELLLLQLEFEYQKKLKADPTYPKYEGVYFDTNENNELVMILEARDDKDTPLSMKIPFDKGNYDKIYESYIDYVNKADSFVFDLVAANKLLSYDDKEMELALNDIYTFAVVENQHEKIIAYIQPFNVNNININDNVCVSTWNDKTKEYYITHYYVVDLFKMSYFAFPREVDDLDVVCYKTAPLELESTKDSYEQLNNEEFSKEILAYANNDFNPDLYPFHLLDGLNLIIASIVEEKNILDSEIDARDYTIEGLDEMADEEKIISTKLVTHLDSDNFEYLTVFVDQDDVNNSNYTRAVYSYKDIIRLFFNMAGKYTGIAFYTKGKVITMPQSKLIELEVNRILTIRSNMIRFLKTLTNEEIEFIGLNRFNVILDVYEKEITLEEVRKNNSYTKEEINDIFGRGYARIKQIIKAKLNQEK